MKPSPARDINGRRIRRGTRVRFLKASASLLTGLRAADRRAIASAVGQVLRVQGFNIAGHAELEFLDSHGAMHFVWVEPGNLRVVR